MSILKKLSVPVLSSILALAPLKSQSQVIYGHIGNILKKEHYSEQGEGIPAELILRNLNNGNRVTINTDEHGNFRYNFNRVISPDYKFNPDEISEAKIFDLYGRYIQSLNPNFTTIPNLPSGWYVSRFIDNKGNFLDAKFINADGTIQGLTIPKKLEERTVSNKSRNRTCSIEPYEITIRDENTDEIGNFYDFKDTLDINTEEDFELNKDLIPVWEIEDQADTSRNLYRNNLHQVKWMTLTDPQQYPEEDRRIYISKWNSYPVNIFYNRNDDQGHNVEALETAINNWETSTTYEDYEPLSLFRESQNIPETGIKMDYTSRPASGTDIANEWETYVVDGQRFYAPKIITVYIGNTLGRRFDWAIGDTRHELGHAIMSSRAHAMNINHIMGPAADPPATSEGLTLRYIVLENPFTRTWNYLED